MEKQFLKAYDEHSDALFRYCYFKVFDRDLAKDLVQEAFTRTWVYITEGKEVENLRAFLYKILHNIIVDHIRKKKSVSLDKMLEVDGFAPEGDGQVDVESFAIARELTEKLNLLDDAERDMVHMRYIDDMSVKDIAKVLGVSVNVVSVRIYRATKKLKDILEKGER